MSAPGTLPDIRVMIVIAGHLPPPVHGMAVAVARFAELLEKSAQRAGGGSVRVRTVPTDRTRGALAYHLARVARVLGAMRQIWAVREHRPAVYVSCDASLGMMYTTVLLGWSRFLGLSPWLHHHSCAYMEETSRLFRGLLLVAGNRTTHLVGCAEMADLLRNVSFAPLRITELPILYAVELPVTPSTRPPPSQSVVLGHLSNLSAEKGLRDVFATYKALRRRSVTTELILAGPAATAKDARLVEEILREGGEGVRYWGPVYGGDREKFFDAIDVFLFPSRYRNESFGLVVGEALVRRVEIVAYSRGCLTADLVSAAGLLLQPGEPFAERAAAWIVGRPSPSSESRFAVVDQMRSEAEKRAEAVAREITEHGREVSSRALSDRCRRAVSQVTSEGFPHGLRGLVRKKR